VIRYTTCYRKGQRKEEFARKDTAELKSICKNMQLTFLKYLGVQEELMLRCLRSFRKRRKSVSTND